MGEPFRHNEQSLRVVDVLEKDGQGLNLTYEVRMGILGHSSHSRMPETLEGQIVRKSDQIAYINHDIDDAMRAGILTNDDIPREISDVLGETHRRAHQYARDGYDLPLTRHGRAGHDTGDRADHAGPAPVHV